LNPFRINIHKKLNLFLRPYWRPFASNQLDEQSKDIIGRWSGISRGTKASSKTKAKQNNSGIMKTTLWESFLHMARFELTLKV